ncbi:MAG: hypothetical protein V4739_15095 [Pseudomonadota bacterium]
MLLVIRLLLVGALAWAMACFALYAITSRPVWRQRGVRVLLGTLAVVLVSAVVIWSQTW